MSSFSKGTRLGLRLKLRAILDEYIRENFRSIQEFVNQQDILRGVFRKFTYEFEEAGTRTIRHNLPFVPCDFLITSTTGGVTVTIDHDTVTKDTFKLTSTGKGKVRMLIGNITDFDVR